MEQFDCNGLHIAGVEYESMVDGDGVRTTIFLSGCPHHCHGCQNPETWDPKYGLPTTEALISQIAREIVVRWEFLNGITLSGGDPFYNPVGTWMFLLSLNAAVSDLLEEHTKSGKLRGGLWIYTGFTFEQLLAERKNNLVVGDLLEMAKVIVDGPYTETLRDVSLPYRGSSNQRLIDVRKSLGAGKAVEWTNQ